MAVKKNVTAKHEKKAPAKKKVEAPKAKAPEKKPELALKKALEAKPVGKPGAKAVPAKPLTPAEAAAAAKAGGRPPSARPKKGPKPRGIQRRGPDGELLNPGDLLLPGGASSLEEVQYLF